jgi:indolepyruvate ferredoxin oxidoreductase
VKCVNETVEQTMTVDLDPVTPVLPDTDPAPDGVYTRFAPYAPLRDEQIALDVWLSRAHAFVRANRIDDTIFRAATPRLGIVAAGKSYGDVRQALAILGLDDAGAAALGISLYKVGCIWPLGAPTSLPAACGQTRRLFGASRGFRFGAETADGQLCSTSL